MKNSNPAQQATVDSQVSLFPILLVNFIGTLGYSIILPFLIVLILKLGGNELIYGVMGATYSFFQFIGAPILGKWSDKYGRKKILLLSQIGTFLAWVFFIIALIIPNTSLAEIESAWLGSFILSVPLVLLFFARGLDGITGGNVSIANAYLSDVSPAEQKKKNFGKMSAAGNLGFIIGPVLAGILGETALQELLPVIMAMLISLVAIFVISFMLKEIDPCALLKPLNVNKVKKVMGQEHKDCYELLGKNNVNLGDVLKIPNVRFILTLYFIIFLAFNFFYVSFPIHAIEKLQWSLLDLGIFFSILGFVMVFVQGPVLSWISDKFTDSFLTIAGSLILAVGFYLFTFENTVLIYSGVILFSAGNGIMWPSFLSILSNVGGNQYQGAIQGYAGSTGSLASIVGLIAGGITYGLLGVYTFLIPAVMLILIFFISFRLRSINIERSND